MQLSTCPPNVDQTNGKIYLRFLDDEVDSSRATPSRKWTFVGVSIASMCITPLLAGASKTAPSLRTAGQFSSRVVTGTIVPRMAAFLHPTAAAGL